MGAREDGVQIGGGGRCLHPQRIVVTIREPLLGEGNPAIESFLNREMDREGGSIHRSFNDLCATCFFIYTSLYYDSYSKPDQTVFPNLSVEKH